MLYVCVHVCVIVTVFRQQKAWRQVCGTGSGGHPWYSFSTFFAVRYILLQHLL